MQKGERLKGTQIMFLCKPNIGKVVFYYMGTVSEPISITDCGAVTQKLYMPTLVKLERAGVIDTVALFNPNPERTTHIGKIFTKGRQYQDLQAMLADCTPDLAIVAAPHRFHADLTTARLERGIPVLREKPIALIITDCDWMVKAADEAGCLLAVGHFRRFSHPPKWLEHSGYLHTRRDQVVPLLGLSLEYTAMTTFTGEYQNIYVRSVYYGS